MAKTEYNIAWAGAIDPLTIGTAKGEDVAAATETDEGKYTFGRLGETGLYSVIVTNENENDTMFVVAFTKTGVGCSCNAFKDGGKRCRHIIAIQKLGNDRETLKRDGISETMMINAIDDTEKWTFDADQNMVPPQPGNSEAPKTPSSDGADTGNAGTATPEVVKAAEGPLPEPAALEEIPPVVEAEIVQPPPEKKKHICKICGAEYDTIDGVLNCIEAHKESDTNTSVTRVETDVPILSAKVSATTAAPMTMIQNLTPRLPEIGRIAVGEKGSSVGKGALPTSLDHFIFTVPEQDETGRCLRDEDMMRMFGEHCTEIPVRLLYNDLQLNFPTFYAKYTRSGIKLRGDGINWIKYNQDGTQEQIYDPDGTHGFLKDPDVKPHGILTVLLDKQDTVGGIFKFRTSSWNSINYILAGMALIERTCGMLTYIPLMLKCKRVEVTPKSLGRKTKITVVWLEFRGSIEDLQNKASEVLRNMTAGQRSSMEQIETAVRATIGADETLEHQIAIADEFYPGVKS